MKNSKSGNQKYVAVRADPGFEFTLERESF